MRYKKILTAALAFTIALLGMGIGSAFAATYGMPYYIEVDITSQIVTVYNTADGSIAYQMLCSTGKNDCTPAGTYYLPNKIKDDERTEWYYMGMYDSWVKYATRIKGPYYFHSITYNSPRDDAISQKALAEFGYPTSHGCIRLRVEDSRWIAQNCMPNTRVRIFHGKSSNDYLRMLLLESSYNGTTGMTYSEYFGAVDGALAYTSVGSEVMDLQLRLRDLGYFKGEVDGRYDMSTLAAVAEVQSDLGIPQNGVTTPELKEIIFSGNAPMAVGQVSLREGNSGPAVKKLQTALQFLGIYDGAVDSVYDVDVIEAVKTFQRLCGYNSDGVASPELQQMAYFEVSRIEQALGSEFEIEQISEEIPMAALNYEKSNVILRSQPSTESAELTKLAYGDQVVVLGVQGDWAMVYTGSGYTGFLYWRFLTPYTAENYVYKYTANGQSISIGNTLEEITSGTAQDERAAFREYYENVQNSGNPGDGSEYATVNTGARSVKLNMRSSASSDGEILAEIPNGTSLRVLIREGEWTCVTYGGQIGYLMNQYLIFADDEPAYDGEETACIPEEDYSEDQPMLAVVLTDAVIHQEASATSLAAGSIAAGSEVQILRVDEETGWVLVSHGGSQGYMQDADLSF